MDRVWATTAMLHESLQKRFAPMIDYNELGRKDYLRTYTQFARFAVEVGQDSTLLSCPRRPEQGGTELPSWYPNLLGKTATSRLLEHRWNRNASYCDVNVRFY
jgi:hypothetical protein